MSPIFGLIAVGIVLLFAVWMQRMGLEILELSPMFWTCVIVFFVLFAGATVLVSFAAPRMDAPADVGLLTSDQGLFSTNQ